MNDYRHRCTTAECPYLGKLTDNLSCGCHRKESETMKAELVRLTTPRPLAEYHEDMGCVLWWCWEEGSECPGHWLGEAPYVGSPNDMGFTVEAEVTMRTHADPGGDGTVTAITRRDVGGWPGYHTHFTPLPPMPEVPK